MPKVPELQTDPAGLLLVQKSHVFALLSSAGFDKVDLPVGFLATAKNETELLVDKVVSTEEERDLYKKRIDDLVSGTDSFEKRITELLDNISTLEAEVERRDAVVMKMAEKYQLVKKTSLLIH